MSVKLKILALSIGAILPVLSYRGMILAEFGKASSFIVGVITILCYGIALGKFFPNLWRDPDEPSSEE